MKNYNIEDYENTCATCKLVTLDKDENRICYATYKEVYKNRKCDCNAYEYSSELNLHILKK